MSIINCPHCDTRIAPTGNNQCPACRRDVTDLRQATANLRAERLRKDVSTLIAAGKSEAVIREFLVEEQRLHPDEVDAGLAQARAHYRAAAEVRGPRDLAIGGLCFVVGAVVTFGSLQMASEKGGIVILAWGPIVFGALRFAVGVQRFINSRQGVASHDA